MDWREGITWYFPGLEESDMRKEKRSGSQNYRDSRYQNKAKKQQTTQALASEFEVTVVVVEATAQSFGARHHRSRRLLLLFVLSVPDEG